MLPDFVWDRHSNPKSGWTRLLAYPVLIAAGFTRRWRLLALTVAFLVCNPLLFPEPESESDDWMHTVVRAEQQWSDRGRPFIGLGFPQILNLLQLPVFASNIYAVYERRPVATVVTTAATMGLKLWFVAELVRRYDPADGSTS
ncbi:DUF6653 family protein [Natrinema salsiterrestre]|uniref:Uncharacterized protein n=1 Tax=Natrinema salsiterrestre TaxID=2950540 RepID=A0A9Q4L6V1_9EURY|nr:DUF6653 family protein [Natrinema salsiterrestre]MDF9747020.1 hypothetical protein [Natrinema salsiterrestre]